MFMNSHKSLFQWTRCHLYYLISWCKHRPLAFHEIEDAVSGMIDAVQDWKFCVIIIFEYTMTFLSFDRLNFLCRGTSGEFRVKSLKGYYNLKGLKYCCFGDWMCTKISRENTKYRCRYIH